MSLANDPVPHGAPFEIGRAVFQALTNAFPTPETKCLDNPERASELRDGNHLVFFEDLSDRPGSDEKGGVAKRTYTFQVGVIERGRDARESVHTRYRKVKRVVRSVLPALKVTAQVISGFREGDVAYRLENIDVNGRLVLGMFSIDYRDPS